MEVVSNWVIYNVDYIKQDPVKWRLYQIGSYTMWIISNRIM